MVLYTTNRISEKGKLLAPPLPWQFASWNSRKHGIAADQRREILLNRSWILQRSTSSRASKLELSAPRNHASIRGTKSALMVMKKLSILFCGLVLTANLTGAEAGLLRARDTRIVNGHGEEVILRGMGLGGWMLQ